MSDQQPTAATQTSSPATPPAVPSERPHKSRRIDNREINAALTKFDGNRVRAAKDLGIGIQSLRRRIAYNEALSIRWGIKGRQFEEAKDPEMELDKMIKDQKYLLDANAQRILTQVKKLEERLNRGEYALLNPEDREAQKFAFRLNAKDEPAEEIMLRNQYSALLEEFRRITDTCANQTLMKAKILSLLRKGQPPGAGRKTPKIGFTAKAKNAQFRAQVLPMEAAS